MAPTRRIFVRKTRRHATRASLRAFAMLVLAGLGVIGGMKLAASLGSQEAAASVREIAVAPVSATPSAAALASEKVAVVDGETIRLSGQVLRLDGVAAPRRGEACRLGTDCAGAAALRLAALVRDQRVDCTVDGADESGHPTARCQAGGTDISRAVVASGWAVAAAASPDLQRAEQSARAAHRGLWAAP